MKYLWSALDAVVIGVDAPRETRLRWYLDRAKERGEDGTTPEEFTLHDNRDFGINEPGLGQQVGMCLEMADIVLMNNGSKKELFVECDRFLKETLDFDSELHPNHPERR